MSPGQSRTLRIAISLGLAALLLYFFLKNLDFHAVGKAIREADAAWLVTALVASLLIIPFRTWRWMRLLRHAGRVRFLDAFSATSIGFAASTLLPARAGEVVRPVALSRSGQIPLAPCLASVGLERLLDLATVILFFVVYAVGGWAPEGLPAKDMSALALLRRSAFLVGAGTAAGLAFLAFLAANPARMDSILGRLVRPFPERWHARLLGVVRSFVAGLGGLRTKSDVLVMTASSLGLWLLIAFQVHATLRAFSLDFPFPVSFFVLTSAVLGLAVPTPGGVGGYHKAVAIALTAFYAVSDSKAAAFAIVSHAISFVPVTVIGLLFLLAGGLSLGTLAADPEARPEKE